MNILSIETYFLMFSLISSIGVIAQDIPPGTFEVVRYTTNDLNDDGTINFEKALGEFHSLGLDLTDDQNSELAKLQSEYLGRKIGQHSASKNVDIESRLNEILLPHQMQHVQSKMYIHHVMSELKQRLSGPRDGESEDKNKPDLGFLKLSKTEESRFMKELESIGRDGEEKARRILFQEIESGISLLPAGSKAKVIDLIGFGPKRIELLKIVDLSEQIESRMSHRLGRKNNAPLSLRNGAEFLSEKEGVWLEMTESQVQDLTTLVNEVIQPKKNSDGSILIRHSIDPAFIEDDRRQLYQRIGEVLTLQQMEELKRLDCWRALSNRTLTELLDVQSVRQKIELSNAQRKQIDLEFKKVLEKSIKELQDLQTDQTKRIVELLPQEWKQRIR